MLHQQSHVGCAGTDAIAEAMVLQALRDIGRRIAKVTGAKRPFDVPDAEWWLTLHSRTAYDASEYVRFQSQWAWNHLPLLLEGHGCGHFTAAQLAAVLDQYVRDLVARHVQHSLPLMQARIEQMARFAAGELTV